MWDKKVLINNKPKFVKKLKISGSKEGVIKLFFKISIKIMFIYLVIKYSQTKFLNSIKIILGFNQKSQIY